MNTIIECKRCLLTNKIPGVKILEDGLCSVCYEHDHIWGNWNKTENMRLESLDRIFSKVRREKRLYDVLVPVSGGKDSIYILYLLRKKYNLKCLAVTWDNGFLSELARENIKNACEILEVDHVYYGINKNQLMRLYRHFFLKTGFFCPVCMRGIYATQNRAQVAFNTPLTVKGTSRRTEEHVSREFFLPGDPNFIENVLDNSDIKAEAEIFLRPAGFFHSPKEIQLPDYIDWNYNNLYKTIKTELKWKEHKEDAEHNDCLVSNIVDYIRFRKFPVLIPELLRFSKLVTSSQLTKDEAKKKLSETIHNIGEPKNLKWFLDEIGISKEEFDKVLEDPLKHIKYLKKKNPAIRRINALRKKRLRLV